MVFFRFPLRFAVVTSRIQDLRNALSPDNWPPVGLLFSGRGSPFRSTYTIFRESQPNIKEASPDLILSKASGRGPRRCSWIPGVLGEGGIQSTRENQAIRRKEPRYRPSQIPFIPKVVHIHTKSHIPKQT